MSEKTELTFNDLPEIVSQILCRITSLETLIQKLYDTSQTKEVGERFFDPKEAASFLRISKARVYTKYSKGELPGMKFGNRLQFSEKDLTELLKSGRRKTNAEIKLEADSYLKNKKK